MIKCIYDECQWPECNKTCGMGSEELIYHLQARINELLKERKEIRDFFRQQMQAMVKGTKWLALDYDIDMACAQACRHGYTDCVYNPEYMRRFYPECWIEDGMPTECEDCHYDNEDK